MSKNTVSEGLVLGLESRIAKLKIGVAATAATFDAEAPIPHLEGTDNGLYARFCKLATAMGEFVADDDALTGEILSHGRRGLRRQMSGGMTNFVKQGSPLEMTATLAHEQGHRYTADVYDMEAHILSETIAEGAAFVVCDHYGLDTSPRCFPYIAGHNNGEFSPDMVDGIKIAAADMIRGLTQIP